MTFPNTPLGIVAQIDADGWIDVPVRGDGLNAVSISRGVSSSGGSQADAGSCSLTIDNADGRFSSRNPRSDLYGLIGRNTPIRVGVAYGVPWLDVPYGQSVAATTPDSVALSIMGDIDIRIDATLAVWGDGLGDFNDDGTSDGATVLAGKTDGVLGLSWWLLVTDTGCLQLKWSPDNTTIKTATSTVPVGLVPWQRQSVRVTLDVNNGASGWTAAFYTSSTQGTAGPWTQLGGTVTGSGTTSIFDSTASLRIGDISALGYGQRARRIHAAQVRNGIAGTVVANPDFTAQTVGATSFTDSAGCVWTVPAGGISNVYPRANMRIPTWTPQWTTGGFDVTTPINAAGRLQQIGQGKRPLQSTLRRYMPAQDGVLVYWPMEDGATATQAASGLAGGHAMGVRGLTFGQDSSLPGSDDLPKVGSSASWAGAITGAPSGAFRAEMMLYIPQTLTGNASPMVIRTDGTAKTWTVTMNNSGGALLAIDFEDGSPIQQITVLSPSANTPMEKAWQRVIVTAAQNGSNIDVTFGFLNDQAQVGWYTQSSVSSSTLGSPSRISGSYGATMQDATIGHIAVYADSSLQWITEFRPEIGAQAGETAAARVARVCDETGTPVSVAGLAASSVVMGPQPHGKVLDVLTDAVTTDESSFLTEALEFDGLRMRTRASLYNQPSVLDLDYNADPQPLIAPLGPPTEDDQRLINDSTVTRTNGSSGRYVQETGPLSIQDPPDGVGTYDENVTRNVYADEQAAQSAGWRVHIGTWDEARYPAITIFVEKDPTLIPKVCAIDTGSRIRITGTLPDWLPGGPLDLLVLGYTETLAQFGWHITYACVPYGPFKVGVRNDTTRGRRDSAGSSLTADAAPTATVLSVTTTTGPAWTTAFLDFPMTWTIAGETVEVIAPGAGLDLADGTFESGVAGWTPTGATFVSSTAQAHTGSKSGLLTVTGTPTSAFVRPDATHKVPATVGTSYVASMWVYAPVALASVAPAIDWLDSGGGYLSTSSAATVTIPAGVWTLIAVQATAPASTAYLRAGPTISGSPATGSQLYVDNLVTIAAASLSASPQQFTVRRSVNGVVKTLPAGSAVNLARPAVRAL